VAKILELRSDKVLNNLEGYSPATNRAYNIGWSDCSGNNNHGVLSASYYFDSRSGWLGSYDFNDYFNLYSGANATRLELPTLYNTVFPQAEGTLFIEVNVTEWTSVNASLIFGDLGNSAAFIRVTQTGSEYGLQCGIINSSGIYDTLIAFADSVNNRITLNATSKIAVKWKTGAGGYFALFINGVKVKQTTTPSTTVAPSAQKFQINRGTDKKKLYRVRLDDTALSDADIIADQTTEWRTSAYTLPTLNKSFVAWGDSIVWTQASGKEYPNLIHNYIQNTYGKMRYYNKGIGGITSAGLKNNLNSLNYIDGDIVTIGVGMNDCANQGVSVNDYTTNLGLAIDFIRSRNANSKIILCTPSGTSDANRMPYIESYRTAMQGVATAKICYICNFHEAVTDENIATYSSDGIHPSVAGHVLLMDKLQPIIDSILA